MGFLDKAKQRAQEAQRKLEESGAIDKAKQAAQQAQQMLDDKQKQWNQGQQGQGQASGPPVRYDKHGRPIEETPAGATPPPSGEPAQAAPDTAPAASPRSAPTPAPPGSPSETAQPAPPDAAPPAPAGAAPPVEQAEDAERQGEDGGLKEDVNRNPDPFRPIQ